MNQNIDHSRYKVIPRVLIFVFQQDSILLIRDNQKKKWQGKFNALGGHIEYGEDILSAAKRELHEEAGITGLDLRLVGNISIDVEPDLGISLSLFKGETETDEVRPSTEGEISWLKLKDIDRQDILEDLNDLLPLVYGWKDGDLMIIGHYKNHNHTEVREFTRA